MFTTLTVGGNDYKLKLSASSTIDLEKKLDKRNPIVVMAGGFVSITDLIHIFHASLQKFHHGINYQATVDLYDLFIDEGGSYFQMLDVLTEVFEKAGFFREAPTTKEQTEDQSSE